MGSVRGLITIARGAVETDSIGPSLSTRNERLEVTEITTLISCIRASVLTDFETMNNNGRYSHIRTSRFYGKKE